MKTKLILVLLAVASLTTLSRAQDIDVTGVTTIEVRYGDLNLRYPAGASIMQGRIRAAAAKVCGGWPATREVADAMRYRACFAATVGNAVADLNAALVADAQGASGTRRTIVVTRH